MLLHNVQTGSGDRPNSNPFGTEGPFLGIKAARSEADNPPPSSVEVKDGGATPPLPHKFSWRVP
jgi:hypothetical protein